MADVQKLTIIKQRVVDELTEYCIIVGYVWVFLIVLQLHRFAILRELNIVYRMDYRIGLALVNALLLGKFILIAQRFKFLDRLKDKRLVWSILFKSAIVALILLVFDIVEEVIVGLVHHKSFVQSIPQMGGGGLEGKLIVCLMAFIVLIPFSAYIELRRVIGGETLRTLLLAKRPPLAQAQAATEISQASERQLKKG
jgi:hypothetical protein